MLRQASEHSCNPVDPREYSRWKNYIAKLKEINSQLEIGLQKHLVSKGQDIIKYWNDMRPVVMDHDNYTPDFIEGNKCTARFMELINRSVEEVIKEAFDTPRPEVPKFSRPITPSKKNIFDGLV